MIEDKLTRDERIRLECLAQANASYAMRIVETSELVILDRAKMFEAYIKGPQEESNAST